MKTRLILFAGLAVAGLAIHALPDSAKNPADLAKRGNARPQSAELSIAPRAANAPGAAANWELLDLTQVRTAAKAADQRPPAETASAGIWATPAEFAEPE